MPAPVPPAAPGRAPAADPQPDAGLLALLRAHGAAVKTVGSPAQGDQHLAAAVAPDQLTNLVAVLQAQRPDVRLLLFGFYPPACRQPATDRRVFMEAVRPGSSPSPRPALGSPRKGPYTALGLDVDDVKKVSLYYPCVAEMMNQNTGIYRLQHAISKIEEAFVWPSVYGSNEVAAALDSLDAADRDLRKVVTSLPRLEVRPLQAGLTGADAAGLESAYAQWAEYLKALDRWLVSTNAPLLKQTVDPSQLPAGGLILARSLDVVADRPAAGETEAKR